MKTMPKMSPKGGAMKTKMKRDALLKIKMMKGGC